jgi:hypothetical protein
MYDRADVKKKHGTVLQVIIYYRQPGLVLTLLAQGGGGGKLPKHTQITLLFSL